MTASARLLLAISLLAVVVHTGKAGILKRAGGAVGDPRDRVVPGVIIIKALPDAALLKGTGVSAALQARLRSTGVQEIQQVFPYLSSGSALARASGAASSLSQIYYGRLAPGVDPRSAAARVGRMQGVEYSEPKYLQRLTDIPNDPMYTADQSRYLGAMHVEQAWAAAKGNGAAIIADVDGGTYWQHEDLLPNLWINAGEDFNENGRFDKGSPPAGDENGVDDDHDGFVDDVIGWNFANNTNDPVGLPSDPESGAHGTATASHFAAVTNNGIGMAGTSWNCKLMLINAASPTTDNTIEFGYEGIVFAAAHGARAINCSWGRAGSFSRFEADVVAAATSAGALIVTSAGNDAEINELGPHYPASFREVLAVGSTAGTSDLLSIYSDYGLSVPVYAPGQNIWSAMSTGGYGNGGSGTSYSSSLTAGLAGILAAQHPAWTARQIATQIRMTSDPIDALNQGIGGWLGHGRVNFYRAVTESHGGLEVVSTQVSSSSGKSYIVTGDTVRLAVTMQNILPLDVTGLQVSISTSGAALRAVSGPVSAGTVASGASVTLPQLTLVADTLTGSSDVAIAIRWTYGASEHDAFPVAVTVFSSPPAWELQDTPSPAGLYSVKAVDRSVVWASGGDGSGTTPSVVRTTDGGRTWANRSGNLSGVDLFCMTATDASHAWVGTQKGTIFATSDGGASWTQQTYAGSQSAFIDGIWFFDAVNGIALGDPPGLRDSRYVILRTSDGGQSWSHIPHEPVGVSGEAGWTNSWWWTDQQHGWFGTNQNKAWRTTDGGDTWTSAPTGAANSIGVAFADAMRGVAVHDNGLSSTSTDGGSTWNPSPVFASYLGGVGFIPGTTVGWTFDPSGPFRTADAGATWAAEATFSFSGSPTHVSAVDTGAAWLATSFGQVLAHLGGVATGVSQHAPGAPVSFALFQNYPNPFNPSTTISFTLDATGGARLAVYDLLGRQVGLLLDQVLPAGRHAVSFDGAHLASGVYLYRLQAGGRTAVGKMALVK